jgi:hypothetical protein
MSNQHAVWVYLRFTLSYRQPAETGDVGMKVQSSGQPTPTSLPGHPVTLTKPARAFWAAGLGVALGVGARSATFHRSISSMPQAVG